jgi:hypothetical protein
VGHRRGYGVTGGWGSVAMPMQCFVEAYRPAGQGIGTVAGWGTPVAGWGAGPLEYAALDQIAGQVTETEIAAAVARVLPVATIAWLRITS